MTHAVLLRKSDHAVAGDILTIGKGAVVDPERPRRRLVSPVVLGWEDDIYKVVPYSPAQPVPTGKRATAPSVRAFDPDSGRVIEQRTLEDLPEARQETVAERVAKLCGDYGLTIDELRAVLGPREVAG